MTYREFADTGYLDGIAQTPRVKTLSDDQQAALHEACLFMDDPERKEMVVGGVAGSGKSSIIPWIISEAYDRGMVPAVCAPTGKAVMVLKRKGITFARTLHSMLYEAKRRTVLLSPNDSPVIFVRRNPEEFTWLNLLVVDEASMISGEMHDYIQTLPFKVIYVGDHFQLPPVNDDFNIMESPDVRLERILRQNQDNPIVMLSDTVRNGGALPYGIFGESVHTRVLDRNDLLKFDEVIVWTNKCKDEVNSLIREMRGFPAGIPVIDDKMIVKANSLSRNVCNGQIVYLTGQRPSKNRDGSWKLEFIDELAHDDPFIMAQTNDYTRVNATVHLSKMEIERRRSYDFKNKKSGCPCVHLDWGYAITCHAAQGSSWGNVAVIDEKRMHFMEDWNRWMYTALTRAEESVHVYTGSISDLLGAGKPEK